MMTYAHKGYSKLALAMFSSHHVIAARHYAISRESMKCCQKPQSDAKTKRRTK